MLNELTKLSIREDLKLTAWLNMVCQSRTENTRQLYTTAMMKYCDVVGLTPSELIEEAEMEISIPFSKQVLSGHMGKFKNTLREEGYANTTRMTYHAILSSFYGSHDIPMSKKFLQRDKKPTICPANDLDLKDEHITLAFSIPNPLIKLAVAIQYTSGLSMSDVRNLTAGAILENRTADFLTCLRIQRQKTNVSFHTFLSPTATKLCLSWIETMKLEANDFLICEEKGKQLSENDYLELYRQTANAIGLKTPAPGEYNKFHSHNLRKMFFNTILKVGGWEMSSLAEYFMGHKIDDTKKAYFRADPENLRKEYSKFVCHFEHVLNPCVALVDQDTKNDPKGMGSMSSD